MKRRVVHARLDPRLCQRLADSIAVDARRQQRDSEVVRGLGLRRNVRERHQRSASSVKCCPVRSHEVRPQGVRLLEAPEFDETDRGPDLVEAIVEPCAATSFWSRRARAPRAGTRYCTGRDTARYGDYDRNRGAAGLV